MLLLVPINFAEANEYISQHHRHHAAVTGHKFSIGCSTDGGQMCGVIMVGRPVARYLDNGWVLEANRCCTDGTKNAASMLYGAAWRATKALGYKKLITYTLPSESGSSLKGAGWKCIGLCGGGNWNSKSRPRVDTELQQKKIRWEVE